MATVIDELAMTLSLDPSKFKEGSKEAEDASQSMAQRILSTLQQIERATEETQKSSAETAKNTMKDHEENLRKHVDKHREAGQAIGEQFNKVGEAIKKAGIELLTFMGIEMTVHGMERLFMDLTKADTAAGFLATTLGVNIRTLGEWQGAAKALGVTAGDVASAIGAIGQDIASLELTGSSRMVEPLRHLGISMETSRGTPKEATDIIQELADKVDEQKKAGTFRADEFQFLLNQMGIGNMMPAISQGGAVMRKAREESRRSGFVNEEDAKASRELMEAFDQISQTVEDIARKIKTAISPEITAVANQIREWLLRNRGWIQEYLIDSLNSVGTLLLEIAADVRAAFDSEPVQAIGGAIKFVATEIDTLVRATSSWKNVIEDIFLLWTGYKFYQILTNIGLVRSALGLIGIAVPGAAAGAGAGAAAGGAGAAVGGLPVAIPAAIIAMNAYTIFHGLSRDKKMEKLGFELDPDVMPDEFGRMSYKRGKERNITVEEVETAVDKEDKRLEEIANKQLEIQKEQLELAKERAAKEDLKDDQYSGRAAGEGDPASVGPTSLTTQQAFKATDMMKDIMRVFEVDQAGAAKIASAIFRESGFKSDISYGNTPYEYGTDKAVGLFQMTGSRHRELETFSKERGLDPKDKETQLAHARWEADKSYPSWRKALESSDPEAFGDLFENGGRRGYQHGTYNERFRNLDLNAAPPVPEITVTPEKPQPSPPKPPLMSPASRPAQHSSLELRHQQVASRADNDAWVLPTETQAGRFLAENFGQQQLGASLSARRSFSATASATDNSRSSETHIGSITVNTQATDAMGIARDLKHAIKQYDYTILADSGLR